MVQDYTFIRINRRSNIWTCSNRQSTQCRAKIRVHDETESLLEYHPDHNHPPPKYHINKQGLYCKAWIPEKNLGTDDDPYFVMRPKGMALLWGEHRYFKQKECKDSTIWRCSEYGKMGCLGSATVKDGCVIRCKSHSCSETSFPNMDLKDEEENPEAET
ncbi:uncharacterized protein LOC135076559 [Ostrinia nubilalis]